MYKSVKRRRLELPRHNCHYPLKVARLPIPPPLQLTFNNSKNGTKTAKMVKSHHNVGGLPEDLQFELVEPLRQLFKDEVRACGVELGLPYDMVYRQPFPGPGLGVRCLGAITRDRLEAVRESDAILREEFQLAGLDKKVWQYFTVVPDFKSVGVRDNARSFDWPVIIRAVNTPELLRTSFHTVP